jgi:hypothetical protein
MNNFLVFIEKETNSSPQVKKYGPVQTRKHRKSLEHGSSIPSGNFPAGSCRKHKKLAGIHRKKSGRFPVVILLPLPSLAGVFLQDPVAGIFDLDNHQTIAFFIL